MTKFITQVLLPALGALYFVAAGSFNIPFEATVGAAILLVVALLNLYYMRKTAKYDGDLVVEEVNEFKALYSFELNEDAEGLAEKGEVRFRVRYA